MEAHDIRAALSSLPTLTIPSSTTAEEADATVREFGSLNQCTLSLMRDSGHSLIAKVRLTNTVQCDPFP